LHFFQSARTRKFQIVSNAHIFFDDEISEKKIFSKKKKNWMEPFSPQSPCSGFRSLRCLRLTALIVLIFFTQYELFLLDRSALQATNSTPRTLTNNDCFVFVSLVVAGLCLARDRTGS
jgi:hypothetical protein